MPDPRRVPVNTRFDGDFVTLLVVVLETDTVGELAAQVAAHVVGKRVPPREAAMVVRYQGHELPPDITVAEAGIRSFGFVSVGWQA